MRVFAFEPAPKHIPLGGDKVKEVFLPILFPETRIERSFFNGNYFVCQPFCL